jgi:hypothetical protein
LNVAYLTSNTGVSYRPVTAGQWLDHLTGNTGVSDRLFTLAQWLDHLTSNTGVSDRLFIVAQWLDHLTSNTGVSDKPVTVAQWLDHQTSNTGVSDRPVTLAQWLDQAKKKVVFLLTRSTLNFSPNPGNFIDPLQKYLICSENIEHILVFATSSKIWAVLHVYRGSMDTGNKTFVQFNENSHNSV